MFEAFGKYRCAYIEGATFPDAAILSISLGVGSALK